MNDETYQTFCNELQELKARRHDDLTIWIQKIQAATIIFLKPSDDWTEDDSIIQVKHMSANDLVNEIDISIIDTEDAYERTLDVIKLPLPIPLERMNTAPQFLFVRPDDISLFAISGNLEACILIGNPGISKSWFQWKFILFCYRQDIYNQLMSSKRSEEHDKEPSFKRQKTLEHIEAYIPQLIVRTKAGESSYFFFINRTSDVKCAQHTPSQLMYVTDKNSTVLWEPGEEHKPVQAKDCHYRIIATVSPDESRYKEFSKDATKLYMPCPNELQIRLMGKIYRDSVKIQEVPSDDEICKRVRKYGPFIRPTLCWHQVKLNEFEIKQDREIKRVCSNEWDLSNSFLSRFHILENSERAFDNLHILSHRLARFVIHRDTSSPYGGYAEAQFSLNSSEVLRKISKEIAKCGIDVVRHHLCAANNGEIIFEDVLPVYLERIVQLYSLEGINWKQYPMQLNVNDCKAMNWEVFTLMLNRVERRITQIQDMEPDVLYYPSDKSFPLVDMYFKDAQGNISCIQATMAKQHSKHISVYESFFAAIGTQPTETKISLYFLIMPCRLHHYLLSNNTLSKFWKGVRLGINNEWKENISFHILLPPDTFVTSFVPGE